MTSLAVRRVTPLVAILLAVCAEPARAERLFVPVAGSPAPGGQVARVQTLALDRQALGSLRARARATLTAFPLGADGPVTLDVARFEPFAPDARVTEVAADGVRALALPDQVYYRGAVAGEPGSLAVVVAAADAVSGMVSSGGTIYRFGPDRTGVYRSWALRDADPAAFPAPQTLCANDVHAGVLGTHPGTTGSTGAPAPGSPPIAAFSPTLLAEVAIETDEEFLALFPGTTQALAYLASLAAEVSAIYDADTQVRVVFRSIRLWSTTDPWTATSTLGMLFEVRDYWNAHEGATPRDTVHFLSGKGVQGGVAYLDVLCDPEFGYGVSTVHGTFDVMDPGDTWDVIVVAHELGHNFGSEHTHCYVPPLDTCYALEPGCYSGPTSVPPGGGTVMSYCHLRAGGLANVNLTFGTTVSAVLRTRAENGLCIGLPCGDGLLDPGEDCDDGNVASGDCCSSTCTAEPDGGACDDGDVCTTGDQCGGGTCAGAPVVDGTPCDDGSACTADSCQSGACIGAPGPAPLCKTPILPLKAQLVLKDKTPDRGDQVVWKWSKGQATDVLEFGDPAGGDAYELCVYGPGPSKVFYGRFPAGGTCGGRPCWKTIPLKGFSYKDKDRTPSGMEKLSLRAGASGAAKASAKGKGDYLDMPALGSLPLPIRAQLRGPGQCWEATFSTAILNTPLQFKAKGPD